MDESTASVDRSKETNKTYIISYPTKENDSSTRLTLQRRKTENKDTTKSEFSDTSNTENLLQVPQKRLTLKRRTRTGSMDKTPISTRPKASVRGPGVTVTEPRHSKILLEPNSRTPRASNVLRTGSVRENVFKTPAKDAFASRTNMSAQVSERNPRLTQKQSVDLTAKTTISKTDDQTTTVSTPTRTTQFGKISAKKEVFERLASKTAPSKSASLERHMTSSQVTSTLGRPGTSRPFNKQPTSSQSRMPSNTPRTTQATKSRCSSLSGALKSRASAETPSVAESTCHGTELSQDSFKMENSAVTVAVRVRPFSSR